MASPQMFAPLTRRSLPERGLTRLALVALSAAAFALTMPWDMRNRLPSPDSVNETTPVTGTGVALLAVSLLLLGAYAGYRDRLHWAVPVVAAPPSAVLFASFVAHSENPDGIFPWPFAWGFFSAVMTAAVALAAWAAAQYRQR